MTEEELNYAYSVRMTLPPAERAAIEKAHAEMVRRKDRERGTPNPPDNVNANLEAAASEVTPDPVLTPRRAPKPRPVDPAAAYAARMEAAGFTPEEAAVGAEYESRQPGGFNPAFSSDETLRAGAAYMRGQDVVEAALERQLDAVYGARPARPVAAARRPEGRVPRDPEDYRFETRTGVVGPRTDDGRKPRLAPTFRDAEEAAEYYVRPRNPETGELMPSRADEAMAARGFVATDTPLGESAYQLGYVAGEPAPEGVIDELNYYRNHRLPNGELAYQMESKDGPTGTFEVLAPSPALRKYQADRAQKLSAERVASKTGLSAAPLMDPEARGAAYRKYHADRKQAQMDRLANRNWLAGGSQNINSGNRAMWNQLATLSPEEQIRQLQYALPGGELRAQVDARQLDMAARLAQNAVTGALAGTAAGPLAQAQADALGLKNTADRAAQRRQIEDDMAEQYAASGWFGYDEFTLEEQQEAIDTLVNVHHYSLPEAQAAVDRIADNRRATQSLPRGGAPSDG